MAKFQFLIERLGALIKEEGKKMILLTIQPHRDPKTMFDKYMETVESVRDRVECVVSASLPGEERLFWPYYDAQFYIKLDKDVISSTGNPEAVQRVFSCGTKEVNTTLPGMDYWKRKNFVYELDNTDYIDEQQLSSGEIELNSQEIIDKYGYRQVKAFENRDWWYLLKFFFIASDFYNLDGFGDLIGGVPKKLKVKCACQNLLDVELFWKGIFKVPEQDFKHEYYLYISHECDSCGRRICIYRPRGPLCPHLLIFMNHLVPDKIYKMSDIEMVSVWHDTFKKAAVKNITMFEQIYSKDIIKFGTFVQEMAKKYEK